MEPNNEQNTWQGDVGDQLEEVGLPEEYVGEELQPISWEASEYIHHDHDAAWIGGFLGITTAFLLLSIFLIKNYFFTALIIVMAIALLVYSRRPPRVLRYTLSLQGLHVSEVFHLYSEYRSFGVIQDGPLYFIKLLPTARFGQEMTLYFAENEGEIIVDMLGAYLPMEDLRLDLVDTLLRRLRL